MDFSNASLLGFQKTNEFLNSDFRFGSKVLYSIEGNFIDLQNQIGVSGTASLSEFFRTGLQDYQPIILNGKDFGKGRVIDFSTDIQQSSLQYSTYNISIEGFQSGNLFNLTGKYYTGLSCLVTGNTTLQSPHLLEDFSENFNIDRNGDQFSYVHNIDIKYASGDGLTVTPIQRAKGLATEIFQNVEPPFDLLESFPGANFFTGAVDEKFSETYDLVTNSVNLSRRFTTKPSGFENYSVQRTQSFVKNNQGDVTVSEAGNIKVKSRTIETDLTDAVKTEITGSYPRCSGLYKAYVSDLILPSGAISTSENINNFLGEADYNVTYGDSNSNDHFNYVFNLSHSLNRDGDIIVVTENGKIIGRGDSESEKMSNSVSGFNVEKLNIFDRCNHFYNSQGGQKSLSLDSSSFTKSTTDQSIGYDYNYSDDTALVDGRRIDITVQDSESLNANNKFFALGEKEFVQGLNTTKQGSRNLSVRIDGNESDNLSGLLASGKIIANNHVEIFNDTYIEDSNYTYSVEDNALDLSVTYYFNKNTGNKELL